MSNPIRILSNNYIQTNEFGVSEKNTGTIRQTPSDIKTIVPGNVQLDGILRGNTTLTSSSSESCRNYSGLKGLRQLKTDQKELSGGQPKCGWMYKPSGGVNPLVSRGAFGSVAGPVDGAPGGKDDVSNGVKWYSDLNQAEMDISTALCSSIQSCDELGKLGAQAELVGYCKTSGAIIPVTRNSKGSIQARYKQNGMGCDKKDIVTSQNLNKCPTDEGFYSGGGGGGGASGRQSLHSTNVRRDQQARPDSQLLWKSRMTEGFFSEGGDDADDDEGVEGDLCDSSPLSRKCIIQAAQFAGCSDGGALIHSLQQGDPTGKQGYNSVLRSKPSFQAYQELMNPRLNDSMLKDGSTTLQAAIDYFSYIPQATTSDTMKLRLAATDLCVNEGAFDAYDFCSEISPTTTITPSHLKCLQKYWKMVGGTEKGSEYGSLLKKYQGRQWSAFLNAMETYKDVIKRSYEHTYENQGAQKERNEKLGEFIGLQQGESKKLELNDSSSRGIECIWENYHDSIKDCIVLGQEIRYANSGGTLYPYIRDGNELKRLIGITRMVGVTILQEQRTTETGQAIAHIKTDGQSDIAHTINGYTHESRSNVKKLMNSKSAVLLSSQPYTVEANAKTPMILITQLYSYFPPSPSFLFNNVETTGGANLSKFAHLTQESKAPWLRLEVCDRVNDVNKRKITLQDTRLRTTIFNVEDKNTTAIINEQSKKEVPGEKCYIRFVSNSSWKTISRFAYTGFRTITMLFRPTSTMNMNEQAYLFSHAYRPDSNTYKGFYISLIHGNKLKVDCWDHGGKYYSWTMPYYVNEWNFLVIQYVKQSDTSEGMLNNIYGITTNCYRFSRLQQSSDTRMDVINELRLFRNNTIGSNPALFYPVPKDGRPGDSSAGQIYLGMIEYHPYPSFTGDVAWIHGYRAAFDDISMLEKEVNQTWKYSWYEPNLP